MPNDIEKQVEILREGIAKWLFEKRKYDYSNKGGDSTWEKDSRDIKRFAFEDADSLLRNLPMKLYLDTGELTEEEQRKIVTNHWRNREGATVDEWCKAARAKFKSIGESMK